MNNKSLLAPVVLCLAACIPCAAADAVIKNKSGKVVYVEVDSSQKASMRKGNSPKTPVDPNRSTITLLPNEVVTLDTTSRENLADIWLTIQKEGKSTTIQYPRMKNKWQVRDGGKVPVVIRPGDVVEVN